MNSLDYHDLDSLAHEIEADAVGPAGLRDQAADEAVSAEGVAHAPQVAGLRYSLELPYPPATANTSTRFGKGRHYKRPEIGQLPAAGGHGVRREGLGWPVAACGPLEVLYRLLPPDPRARDGDNVVKVVQDALTRARV